MQTIAAVASSNTSSGLIAHIAACWCSLPTVFSAVGAPTDAKRAEIHRFCAVLHSEWPFEAKRVD